MQIRTIAVISALAATAAFGQNNNTTAAKPVPHAETPAPAPPSLNTSRLWRLLVNAQNLRQQAKDTPQWKAADAADAEVAKEQDVQSSKCAAAGFVLGFAEKGSPNEGDVVCVPKPKEQPAPPAQEKGK